jgi:C-terminal peptidase prc
MVVLATAACTRATSGSTTSTTPAGTSTTGGATGSTTSTTIAVTPYIPPECAGTTITTLPLDDPPPTTVPPEALSTERQFLLVETIDDLVQENYFDPNLGGTDWNTAVATLSAAIEAGMTTATLYERISALVESLADEHSRFETPEEVATFDEIFSGDNDYVGIGILAITDFDEGLVTIVTVFPGSPADRSGLRPHDSIVAVDGLPMGDDPAARAYRLRGPECSLVVMTVRSPGEEERSVAAVRARVQGNVAIHAALVPVDDGRRVAYILIPTFFDMTIDDQVRDALEEFGPLDGLIIDLRPNGGGSSVVAEPIMSLFVGGTVGDYLSRDGTRALSLEADPVHNSDTVPLAILVGEHTESYGEIVAGILGARDRSVVIGETTMGNVETLHGFALPGGSMLWVAAEVFRPRSDPDADWERDGIVPDIEVEVDWHDFTFDTDPALDPALEALAGV